VPKGERGRVCGTWADLLMRHRSMRMSQAQHRSPANRGSGYRPSPPEGRRNMRRGLIALLTAALVLAAGVAAAAAASGDSPLDLLRAKPAKHTVQRPRVPSSSRAQANSTAPRSSKGSAKERDDQAGDAAEGSPGDTTSQESASPTVMLCHHTGSWKHPFHAIRVDEHAVAAHTAHGDAVGACPGTLAGATPPSKHEKQISPERAHPRNHGRAGQQHGRGHDKGRRPHGGARDQAPH